jgi:hypothetical protein
LSYNPRRLNVKNNYRLSVLMTLAFSLMAATAWAEETADAAEPKGGIGCTMQNAEQAATGCGGHAAAEMKNEKEVLSPCGMPETSGNEAAQAATRSAMMDGRAGGWPRRHDKRPLGAKPPAEVEQARALKHGGCS